MRNFGSLGFLEDWGASTELNCVAILLNCVAILLNRVAILRKPFFGMTFEI